MNTHHLSRTTLGIPGLLGALLLLTWVVGWAAFGMHGRGFHLLVPVGALLLLVQGVRRVNSADDD